MTSDDYASRKRFAAKFATLFTTFDRIVSANPAGNLVGGQTLTSMHHQIPDGGWSSYWGNIHRCEVWQTLNNDIQRLDHTYSREVLATSTWQIVLKADDAILNAVSNLECTSRDTILSLDQLSSIRHLLNAKLSKLIGIGREFYLWCLGELIEELPTNRIQDEMVRLKELIRQHDCKSHHPVPVRAIQLACILHPITGNIGALGGQLALNAMIGEYSARPPTRAEVIARLLC